MERGTFMEIINTVKEIHTGAWEKAKETMPELELNEIMERITLVIKDEMTIAQVAQEFADKYKEPFDVYEKALLSLTVQKGISLVPIEQLHELANDEFAETVIASVKQASDTVKAYVNGKLEVSEFIQQLGMNFETAGFNVLGAYGYDKEQLAKLTNAFRNAQWFMVSEICFSEVYKILKQVDEEAQAQHELRIRIEEECSKSIEMMKRHRMEMNQLVDTYLSEHHETFANALDTMEKAILDQDVNGYIRGNTEIQKMLGYEVQFSNEDEFDALMNSDEAFKL